MKTTTTPHLLKNNYSFGKLVAGRFTHIDNVAFGMEQFEVDASLLDETEVKRSTPESWSDLHSLSPYDKTVAALPNRRMTVEMVLYTRVASRIQISNLGHYDTNFIVDKRALAVLEE